MSPFVAAAKAPGVKGMLLAMKNGKMRVAMRRTKEKTKETKGDELKRKRSDVSSS